MDLMTALLAGKVAGASGSGGSPKVFENTTWAQLKARRDGSTLTPGRQYRITDYVCTSTEEDTIVESHPFDIIVTANGASEISENARVIMKDDDNYYNVAGSTNAELSAWEISYCLDNDSDRFAWADTVNGKGVIYYMKDDRGNECPYDFKQIKFKMVEILEYETKPSLVGAYIIAKNVPSSGMTVDSENPKYLFTFSYIDDTTNSILDSSITTNGNVLVYGNVIMSCYEE